MSIQQHQRWDWKDAGQQVVVVDDGKEPDQGYPLADIADGVAEGRIKGAAFPEDFEEAVLAGRVPRATPLRDFLREQEDRLAVAYGPFMRRAEVRVAVFFFFGLVV